MWTAIGIIWAVIKDLFGRKDPVAAQVKADLNNARKVREENDKMQQPVPDKKTVVDNLP
jgi:hypothetical protein